MSFYTSLSGLRASQTDLSVISNNIANVGSYGFKQSFAQFGDLMPPSSGMAGQGTHLKSIDQDFTQGSFDTSSRSLDLALNGNGFFVTRDSVTGGQTYFSRNGSLQINNGRYLVDLNGGLVQALPVDSNGNITANDISSAENVQIPLTHGSPVATSEMDITATLPAGANVPSVATFDRNDPNSYNYSQQTTVYDSAGDAIPATMYFVRTSTTTSGGATDTWDVHMFVGDQEASTSAGGTTPLQLAFGSGGTLTTPSGPVTFQDVTPAGASAPLGITVNFGAATQQASGTFNIASLQQDGVASAKLSDVTIGQDGLITATFSDSSTVALGKLLICNFSNPEGLKQQGDARWSATGNSGPAISGTAGADGMGSIQTGALERSNVDITQELVALIAAQRNFQANSKAIETDNTMTDSIINMRS